MDEKQYAGLVSLMKDILFQLHILTSHNFYSMATSDNDQTQEFGMKGLAQEQAWMEQFLGMKGGGQECPSGNSFSSDS